MDLLDFLPVSGPATRLKDLGIGRLFLQARDEDYPPHIGIKLDLTSPEEADRLDVLGLTPWHGRVQPPAVFTKVENDYVIDLGSNAHIEFDPSVGTLGYDWKATCRLSFSPVGVLLMARNASGISHRNTFTLDSRTWRAADAGSPLESTLRSWRIVGRWDDGVREFFRYVPSAE